MADSALVVRLPRYLGLTELGRYIGETGKKVSIGQGNSILKDVKLPAIKFFLSCHLLDIAPHLGAVGLVEVGAQVAVVQTPGGEFYMT